MSKILLIEANASHARLIRERLTGEIPSALIDVVSTAREGLKKLSRKGYDCILTDAIAPDESGPELVKKLKKSSGNTPIVVVTGRNDERILTEMIRSGASEYLPKSRVSLEAIPEVVKRTVARKAVHKNPFMIPANVLGKILDEVEEAVSANVRKKIRRIRKNAEKIFRKG